ncbi:MAG: hypothetical protein HP493_00825 [Nitrospira sp.]|nr:hypothetical protein [Nitrospira sp.]
MPIQKGGSSQFRFVGGCYGVLLRCVTVRTKGVTMDSTFLMFAVIMLGILVGGIVVYKKSQ